MGERGGKGGRGWVGEQKGERRSQKKNAIKIWQKLKKKGDGQWKKRKNLEKRKNQLEEGGERGEKKNIKRKIKKLHTCLDGVENDEIIVRVKGTEVNPVKGEGSGGEKPSLYQKRETRGNPFPLKADFTYLESLGEGIEGQKIQSTEGEGKLGEKD